MFYGYDTTVLKVFFTAAIVALVGSQILSFLGLLNLNLVFVNHYYLGATLIGGTIMGAGFIMGGFCPGTGISALAIGKIDAWVYVNGNNIGIFELPAKIPIHAIGSYDLAIFPGIKNTSLIPERIKYPFLNSFDSTLISNEHQVDTIIPTVTYKTTPTIWIEDFEDPGIKFTSDSTSDTTLKITSISTP